MATNLRLPPAAEAALKAEAVRTGRSQQEIIRAAVGQYLRLTPPAEPRTEVDGLIAGGAVLPVRAPFREATDRLAMPAGVSSLDLLDRDDRV